MELKLMYLDSTTNTLNGLNRTFYGIETFGNSDGRGSLFVLIVPFMELKPPLLDLSGEEITS